VAVGLGRKAASHIDGWLRGATVAVAPHREVASFERLSPWYDSDAPKTLRPQLDLARRTSSFDEVQGGLAEDNALCEARRCLSCGSGLECDNCCGVCPDNAVIQLGPGQRLRCSYDCGKGCGICVAECPCGAIEMVPEQS
jgi:Pyruvate/2-oxoacid:ferredoxin oxidoreductase delta subunit